MTQQELEKYLWGAATALRGTIDAGDYKQYIFPLLFFKRICDVYDEEFEKEWISLEQLYIQCPDCSNRFTSHSYLKVHISKVHNAEKDNPCSKCGKFFCSAAYRRSARQGCLETSVAQC